MPGPISGAGLPRSASSATDVVATPDIGTPSAHFARLINRRE
jgi:hypothetical protein